jgi:ABC-type multidrug transport system fused ATPase/permease subunit
LKTLIVAYAGLEFTVMAFVASKSVPAGDEVLAAAIIATITPFLLLLLSWSEHFRSLRPSGVLNTYLLLTLLFDAALVRTSWLAFGGRLGYTISLTVKVGLKLVMVVLEAVPKRRWSIAQSQDTSPEETSGVYSLALMSWLAPLMTLGSRQALALEDLYPLDSRLASMRQHKKFQRVREASSMHPTDKSLLRVLARTLGIGLLRPVIPRLLLMGFSFAQPFFIQRLIRFLQGGDDVPGYLEGNLGYGLIGASFFIYAGIALSTAVYWYLHFRTIMKLRAILATAIFAKARQVSSHKLDDAVLTLMSTDVSRVVGGIQNVHEVWANTIEVALAAWLLEREIGAAFVAPIVVVAICIACTTVVAKGADSRQGEWTKKTQNRVTVTSSVIGHIKAILISGRAEHLASMVQKLRDDELRAGSRFRILMVFSTCIAFAPMLVSPLMTFAVAARSLGTAQVYASLAYLMLLASPLTQLFQTLPSTVASKASLDRIQAFLAAPPRVDYRVVLPTGKPSSENSQRSAGGPTISFQNVSLGWEEAKWQLSHLNLAIPSARLTIIRGPVASGKSTLARALLGEVPFVEGKVEFSSAHGRTGFCAQTPFLTNGTIRSNILGPELFDSSRYESVLQATLLKLDIESLPERDETWVGSGGLTLSGGQKQRVALARALYLEAGLYVIDNALSGLDAQTADEIAQRVFGPAGFLCDKKATVVWCTESSKFLSLAHQLVVLGANNTVEYCGPPQEDQKHYVAPSAAKAEVFREPTPSIKQTARIPKERSSHAQHDREVYSHYCAAIGPSVTAAVLLFGCCFSFSYNFGTVWLNFWAEDFFQRPASQFHPFYLGIYALVQISGLICLGIYVGSTGVVMVTRGGSHLHHTAIRSLFRMPLSYFAETDRGAITNLFSQDMALVDGPLSFAISNTLLSGFTALGQAVVVAVATPLVAVGYPVLLGVLYLLQRYYLKTSRQLRLLDLEGKSPL